MPSFSFVKCHSYTTIKDVAHSTEMGNINALNMHYISKLPRSSYLRAITQPWKFCASAVPSFLSTLYVSDMLEQGWLCGCGVELNCSASSFIDIISIESGKEEFCCVRTAAAQGFWGPSSWMYIYFTCVKEKTTFSVIRQPIKSMCPNVQLILKCYISLPCL